MQPVQFAVQAVVTGSELQFDRSEVDFGLCSLRQSVRSSVRLSNLSLLPQDFGFLAVPEVQHTSRYPKCCICIFVYFDSGLDPKPDTVNKEQSLQLAALNMPRPWIDSLFLRFSLFIQLLES